MSIANPKPIVPLLRSGGLSIGRCIHGLRVTDLFPDLEGPRGGTSTVIAPIDDAFDRLPWTFERLLEDDDLIEPRFDLFEYLVLRGGPDPHGPLLAHTTLHGDHVLLGRGIVVGREGAAEILASVTCGTMRVHVVSGCVFPQGLLEFRADRM